MSAVIFIAFSSYSLAAPPRLTGIDLDGGQGLFNYSYPYGPASIITSLHAASVSADTVSVIAPWIGMDGAVVSGHFIVWHWQLGFEFPKLIANKSNPSCPDHEDQGIAWSPSELHAVICCAGGTGVCLFDAINGSISDPFLLLADDPHWELGGAVWSEDSPTAVVAGSFLACFTMYSEAPNGTWTVLHTFPPGLNVVIPASDKTAAGVLYDPTQSSFQVIVYNATGQATSSLDTVYGAGVAVQVVPGAGAALEVTSSDGFLTQVTVVHARTTAKAVALQPVASGCAFSWLGVLSGGVSGELWYTGRGYLWPTGGWCYFTTLYWAQYLVQ